jgi:hypothetical protein
MLIIVIMLAVMVSCIVAAYKLAYDHEVLSYIMSIIAVLLGIALIVVGISAAIANAYKDVNTAKLRQKHDALVMQIEKGYYDRFTYDGRKALVDEIVAYNAKVTEGKALCHSIWIGAMYPEDWDSLPLIELEDT